MFKKEDYWAIWIGFFLIILSICCVWPFLPATAEGSFSNPAQDWITKPLAWQTNPLASLGVSGEGSPVILPLLVLGAGFAILYGIALAGMGQSFGRFVSAFPAIFGLGVLAYIIAQQTVVRNYGLSYVLWALILGLLISNTLRTPAWLRPAVKTELYIKTGLVLLGAEILFGKILLLGMPGLMVAWMVTPIVVVVMFWVGARLLRISPTLSILIAAATSVCGVSAAIATAAACKARKEELTLTIGMSLLFTVIMMVAMPALINLMDMDIAVGAAWMGGTIDSTGAVAAAGAMLGTEALEIAAVVKMIQNILIGVIAFGVAVYWVTSVDRDTDAKPSVMEIWYRFPKFILGFLAASVVFSILYAMLGAAMGSMAIDDGVIKLTKTFRGWFFCLAFVCIGLESNLKDLWGEMGSTGMPLGLYMIGQTFNILLTLFVAWLAFGFFFTQVIG